MRHGLICDMRALAEPSGLSDIDHEPMAQGIAANGSTLSVHILLVLLRPEVDYQAWVI